MDVLEVFKETQRARWANFAALQSNTIPPAAKLVRFAGIQRGHRVLDVACGTGVVAVTAARMGATVTGLDLTPQLLEVARGNARTAAVGVEWHEGDVESLPFAAGGFDVVVSQYGHIFAPRPDVALAEMLRVLRPGGVIAFSTWPPELFVGRMFALVGRYVPPPPRGIAPPTEWGDPAIVRQRLGAMVRDIVFHRSEMKVPALSPQHHREMTERTAGPVVSLVESLSASDPAKLETFRREYDALLADYFDGNMVKQGYLLTRAVKV